jgi:hypothetical protein
MAVRIIDSVDVEPAPLGIVLDQRRHESGEGQKLGPSSR